MFNQKLCQMKMIRNAGLPITNIHLNPIILVFFFSQLYNLQRLLSVCEFPCHNFIIPVHVALASQFWNLNFWQLTLNMQVKMQSRRTVVLCTRCCKGRGTNEIYIYKCSHSYSKAVCCMWNSEGKPFSTEKGEDNNTQNVLSTVTAFL